MAQHESYQGLARKWRPQRFEDLVGQEAVAQSFQSALRQGRVVHGHLLAGPRGVGKTTSARILAKALNCEHGPTPTPCGQCRHCLDIAAGIDLDVLEIDAASNTGVDNIRELRERVVQATFAARYKVYIIDEVHMLSVPAFNALLKTLEEPPGWVIFILATTELEKVPETIRSRCVVHTFRRLSAEDIVRRLEQVAAGEGVKIEPVLAREIYGLIARSVEGGMRDALVAFDQLLALTEGQPDVESTIRLLGLADQSALTQTVGWMTEGNAAALLKLIEELVERGRSLERFVKSLIAYLRDLMLLQATGEGQLVSITGEALEAAQTQARQLPPATLFNILNQMFELEGKLKQSTQTRFLIEFTFIRIASIRPVVPLEEILRRVRALPEGALASAPAGSSPPAVGSAPAPPRPAARPAQARVPLMHDSAPAAPSAPPTSAGAQMIAETKGWATVTTDPDELIETLVPQLPDIFHFLGRYLRQAALLRPEGAGLRVQWRENSSLARRMIEKPDNVRVLEETLKLVYGKPMKLWSEDLPEGASVGTPSAASAPASSTWAHNEALFNDSSAPRAKSAAEEIGESESAPLESEAEEEEPRERFAARPPLAAAPPSSEPAADPRNALQKAQDFLQTGDDAVRRVKLLKDMFGGRLIDDSGRPLAI